MKVSVITVCFNSEATIEDTLRSMQAQTHGNIEYIIIDGSSTDKTLQIIERYKHITAKVISEPDKGIFDAMNKGIGLATGDIIGILNSDDFYKSADALSKVVNAFASGVSAVYGDIEYVKKNETKKVVRYWRSGIFSKIKMKYGWMPPHPAFFVRADVYKKYGTFNTQLRVSADYELMLRVLYKQKIKVAYLNKTLVCMRIGGNSNNSIKSRLKANNEDKLAWKINNLDYSFFTTILKPIRKIPQFIFKNKH